MTSEISLGDHVRWNSEAGHVQGTSMNVDTEDVECKGHTHHCSPEDPQYEITSNTTDHVAMHEGTALTKI